MKPSAEKPGDAGARPSGGRGADASSSDARTAAARSGNPTGVRRTVLEALLEAESSKRFIDDILAPRLAEFRERDRRLVQEIAYGVLRHRNTLDRLVDFYLKHPVPRQKPPVAWALRAGAYQLVYLERIPAHAAVNQTVEALKTSTLVGTGEVGFVNAVLHKLSEDVRRKTEEPPGDPHDPTALPVRRGYCHFSRPVLPLRTLDPVGHLAFKLSHPPWLVKRWLARYGEEETQKLCARNNITPPITARVTRRAPSRDELLAALRTEGWQASPGSLENSILIEKCGAFQDSEAFRKGWFQVQDLTAIQIGEALKPPPGARALDLCAAPGTKSAQILEAIGPEGRLVATDRTEEKLALLRETLAKVGSNFSTALVSEEPERIELGERFSHILVDAPCSNTGVLARRPEARWRVRSGDLAELAKLQLALLEAALRHLEPGGRLVYATCSIEPDENENVVAEFFARNPGLVELDTRLFLPHRSEGDGGFYSLILHSRAAS